jgi:site-specific recombinase XerD
VIKREIAIIVLLYGTGLRISEALNLKVSDISIDSFCIVSTEIAMSPKSHLLDNCSH